MGVIERYSIYYAKLDPTVGSEIKKTRPVVVISPTNMNTQLDTVVVCPLTTKLKPKWRTRFTINCLNRKADIMLDQIRAISKNGILTKVDFLKKSDTSQIRLLIRQLYAEE